MEEQQNCEKRWRQLSPDEQVSVGDKWEMNGRDGSVYGICGKCPYITPNGFHVELTVGLVTLLRYDGLLRFYREVAELKPFLGTAQVTSDGVPYVRGEGDSFMDYPDGTPVVVVPLPATQAVSHEPELKKMEE